MSWSCCRAGAEAFPGPCPWGHDNLTDWNVQVRLSSDDSPLSVGSEDPGNESNKSLNGLDNRLESWLGFRKGLIVGLIIGNLIWIVLSLIWFYVIAR
jgi:hypothetical protein